MMGNPAVAGVAYFAVVFAAGFVLGAFRQIVLLPRFGAVIAVLIELPFLLTFSWMAAGMIVRRFRVSEATSARLVMGLTAFAILQMAEYGLGVAMVGMSALQYAQSFASTHGMLGLAGQLAFAVLPVFVRGRS